MFRRLFPVAASVSFVVAVLAITLWTLSYDGHNSIFRTRFLPADPASAQVDPARRAIRSTDLIAVVDGELVLGSSRAPAFDVRPSSGWHVFTLPSHNLIADDAFLHRMGLGIFRQTTPRGKTTRFLVPMWAVVGATMILPAWWYFRWSRKRERRVNSCTSCGHVLANLDGNNCPNCSAPIARPAQPQFA